MYIVSLMVLNKKERTYFTKALMAWHDVENNRVLPWKEEKDPYKIWLSEIILQQTRAEQGLPYYLKFIKAYPTIAELAKAEDEAVFRLWQGLGYYNRCRNMLVTARYIAEDLGGAFPNKHNDILQLKGIGDYTAAAIASFAFGLPHAVVDGNVYRVVSRFFGIETPIDITEGKKLFASLAHQLLDVNESAAYNQAIMDLGATVCTPKSPDCANCPLEKKCIATKKGLIALLPIKSKKLKVKKRFLHYILFIEEGKMWIRKRTGKDVWQNLYEPFLIEHGCVLDRQGIIKQVESHGFGLKKNITNEGYLKQRLTHQQLEIHFFECNKGMKKTLPSDGVWVQISELKDYPFPKSIVSFFEKKLYI